MKKQPKAKVAKGKKSPVKGGGGTIKPAPAKKIA